MVMVTLSTLVMNWMNDGHLPFRFAQVLPKRSPSNMPKYRKICPKYGQISLNLSQNFVPICLRVAVDTELRRPDVRAGFGPPAAVCNEFTFNER